MATRAALRVLPLALLSHDQAASVPVIEEHTKHRALAAFRSAFVAWVSNVYGDTNDLAVQAALAFLDAPARAGGLDEADFAVLAAANAAGTVVGNDQRVTYPIERAVDLAVASIHYAASAAELLNGLDGRRVLWESVTEDARSLASRNETPLINRPLWLADVRGNTKFGANFPIWAREPFDAFDKALAGSAWGVCLTWYRGVLPNSRRGKPRSPFGASFDLKLALKDREFWLESSDRVVEKIADLAGFTYVPGATEEKIESRQEDKKAENEKASSTELAFLSDAHDPAVDYLDRGRLAFVLAARLNQIWDSMNGDSAPSKISGDWPQPGFVVHIDAPWGGGKTSFSEFVATLLNPYRHLGPLPSWTKELHLDDTAYWPEGYRRPWYIVNFNAWRHQHVKPPWWVFAESIRNSCARAALHETNQKCDVLPLPTTKFSYRSKVGRRLHSFFCWVAEQVWRIWTPDFRTRFLIALFASSLLAVLFGYEFVSFGDKGIQPNKSNSESPVWLAPLVLLLGGAPAVWTFLTALTQTLLPGTPEAAQNYSLGAGDPLRRFREHFAKTIRRYRRPVLVIVDDLDRCDPNYVTELIRGMQTILVSQRVVFLLLGDRDWIEQSFSETYKAMKGIYVGPEHEFGARFVEKAIQFSFVLPDISKPRRSAYVRSLLHLDDEPAVGSPDLQQPLKRAAEDVLSKDNYLDREAAAEDLRRSAALQELDESTTDKVLRDLDVKLSLRAAADTSVERATSHMLEALAPLLPSNPRQIKRIVNALSLMQEAARLQNVARPGSAEWQVLARWIVILTEWPKSSYTLSRYPGLADKALELEGSSELPDRDVDKFVDAIKANKPVMELLVFAEPSKGWHRRDIGSEQISWLRTLMPPASGRFLDIRPVIAK